MNAEQALQAILSNLPPTAKEAARLFNGMLDIDTTYTLENHIRPIADRYISIDAEAEMRDELQRIADGPFGKTRRIRDGDESILFFKRDRRTCPAEIWAAHKGPPDAPSRGGVYVKIWPKHPDVHWHRKHKDNAFAALERVEPDGTRVIVSDDVVAAFGIVGNEDVNARQQAAGRINSDPHYINIGDHKWANISTLPPARRASVGDKACDRVLNSGRKGFARAILAGRFEEVANTFAALTRCLDIDMFPRVVSAINNELTRRIAEEKKEAEQMKAPARK